MAVAWLALAQTTAVKPRLPAGVAEAASDSSSTHKITLVKDPKSGFSWSVEPEPKWAVAPALVATQAAATAPWHYKLIDHQIQVKGQSSERYVHVIRVVNAASGLDQAAHIEAEFDPGYQSLVLHHLDVLRNGVRMNRLQPGQIRLLQRETQLERQMYDGRVTMSVVLNDIRPGDEIDYAYTVRGANPVFSGRFSMWDNVASDAAPTDLYQLRLLAPEDRVIRYHANTDQLQVKTQMAAGVRETVFRKEHIPQLSLDEGANYQALDPNEIQLSEYRDWADVTAWGASLFVNPGADGSVRQKAQAIRDKFPTKPDQLLAALEFVQKDIRYFGTETGIYSHHPAAPDKVLAQRFGDCKDKVGLLLALLKELDIPAAPVLVSTFWRGHLEDALPSPLDFDHAIAKVDLDGKTWWLDATRSYQTGPLAARQSHGLGSGLVLNGQALSSLPEAWDTPRMAVEDSIHIDKFKEDPKLTSRITYYGDLADAYRQAVATRGLEAVAVELNAPYVKTYPQIKSLQAVKVEEATDDNAISFVQQYVVPRFWRFPQQQILVGDTVQWAPLQALIFPKSQTRKDPLGIAWPGLYRHKIVVEFPEDVGEKESSPHFDDVAGPARLYSEFDIRKNRVEKMAELRLEADQVEAKDWPVFSEKLRALQNRLGGVVVMAAIAPSQLVALKADLAAVGKKAVKADAKSPDRTRAQAMFKSLLLTAQIESGRLPPLLEAQARNERGIQFDQQGLDEKAKPDFDKAMALDPDNLDYKEGAAVNAIARADYQAAVALTNGILQKNPKQTAALDDRARARYFLADFAAADQDYAEILKDRDAIRNGYALVWRSLVQRALGKEPARLEGEYPVEGLSSAWPRPLVNWMWDQTSEESVVNAANAEKDPAGALCETYFYMAERFYLQGDQAKAKEYWQKALDQHAFGYVEDEGARYRLGVKR